MPAMDDFMADVDRRPILLEREIDNVDGPVDSGAKTAWIGEVNLHERPFPETVHGHIRARYSQITGIHLTSALPAPSTQLPRASSCPAPS